MATQWRAWIPEEAARRDVEYVRLLAAADAATRRNVVARVMQPLWGGTCNILANT